MKQNRRTGSHRASRYLSLYLLFIPIVAYLVVFRYWPILSGFILSLKDYKIAEGILGSPFIGLENYLKVFSHPQILRALHNTIEISLLRLAVGFFPPILLAILLYDMVLVRLRKAYQTLLFVPHFFSWVVVFGIVTALFSRSTGLVNHLLTLFGQPGVDFLLSKAWFRPILVGSAIWKEVGWSTIIYTAALTGIDRELYEAAAIDGAGPIRRIRYISIPGIMPIITFVLVISVGGILRAGGEQILLFYNNATLPVADVLETWTLRIGLGQFQYNLGNTVGIIQSTIGLVLVIITNSVSRRYFGRSIW